MKFKLSSYITFSGIKYVVELMNKKDTQWVIYQDDKPKFFVDFFYFERESNVMMNSLVLCGKKSIEEVLELINDRNNVHLSVRVITKLGIKRKLNSKIIELDLQPLPEEWLDYSL